MCVDAVVIVALVKVSAGVRPRVGSSLPLAPVAAYSAHILVCGWVRSPFRLAM